MKDKKLISIVIPSYKEEENIPLIYKEIVKSWKILEEKYDYEIIFVNDGSPDNSWLVIKEICSNDKNVHGINFSKNFGHQAAIEAGLKESKGNAIIMMDCDMQHPPYLISKLISEWENGFDIVNTKRFYAKGIPLFKKITSSLFYWVINKLSSIKIDPGSSDFRLIDKKVVDELNKLTERNKFYRGLINWVGYKSTLVDFVAGERVNGNSSYSFKKMLEFARVGITSFSLLPMKIVSALGVILFLIGLSMTSLMLIVKYFFDPNFFSGTAILASFIILNNGILLTVLGIISLYQINMLQELQNRPGYMVQEKI